MDCNLVKQHLVGIVVKTIRWLSLCAQVNVNRLSCAIPMSNCFTQLKEMANEIIILSRYVFLALLCLYPASELLNFVCNWINYNI